MASLDVSLDDMIKSRRNSDRKGSGLQGREQGRLRRGRGPVISGRGGGRTFAAIRRNPLGVNAAGRSAYPISKSFRRGKSLPWQNGLFEESLKAAGMSGLETGSKLFVSNLAVGVTSEDIRELFSDIGELVRYALHFDKNGRPSGSAEVVYMRRSDAFQAFKRYNNVQLDGKPIKVEIVGAKDITPVTAHVNVAGGAVRKRTVVMNSGAGRARGGFTGANHVSVQRGRGGSSSNVQGVRGGGRGRGVGGALRRGGGGALRRGGAHGKKKTVEKTADELDKELENYHAEAMQT